MASRFQSRLVGTIILAALGVIILPDLLDGKKSHYQDDIAAIPLKPESQIDIQSLQVPEPQVDSSQLPESPVSVVIDTPEAETTSVVVKQEEEPAQTWDVVPTTVKEVEPTNEYQESAWIIQLMALKNADNANRLVSDLRKRGFTASTKTENGFTRVLIGPDVSREKLEQQLLQLEEITGAKGQLIKFSPLNP